MRAQKESRVRREDSGAVQPWVCPVCKARNKKEATVCGCQYGSDMHDAYLPSWVRAR